MSISRTLARVQRRHRPLRAAALSGVLAAGVGVTGMSASAHAATPAELERQGVTQIIVKRQPQLTAAERADLRADAGVDLVRRLVLPGTEVVSVDPGELGEALAALRRDPDVVYAEPDAIVSAAADADWNAQWGMENTGQLIDGTAGSADADIDAIDAWRASTGTGQTVAVIDSGIEFGHPDLAGQVAANAGESGAKATNGIDDDGNGFVDDVRGWDWVGAANAPGDVDNDPSDGAGHGTHVAGIIAAKRDNGIGVAGIAPGARVLPLRVLDNANGGVLSDAVEALYYAGRFGVRVANASLGIPASRTTDANIRSLRDAMAANPRTLYVFAAGNSTTSERFYPCATEQDNVLCVGASDNRDERAAFSNHSSEWVDLYAPGQSIRSTYRGGYATLNGTSMAAPLAAGTVALVATAHPTLSVAGLKARVFDGAERKSAFAASVTGGRLNAATAVGSATAQAPAPTPTASPTPAPTATPAEQPLPTTPVVEAAPDEPAATPATTEAPAPATTTPAPAPATTTTAPAVAVAPSLSGLAVSSRTLRRSLKVTFRLDRPASTRFALSRKVCRGGRCVYKTVRTWTVAARAGANTQVLRRSAGGRRLAAGGYRLSAQAIDGSRRSPLRTIAFGVR